MKDSKYKKLIILGIICLIIVITELLIMMIISIKREKDVNHIDSLNNIIEANNGYIAVGESDFAKSKDADKKIYKYVDPITNKEQNIIATQAKIAKYNQNFQLEWEKTIDNDYDSTFYDALKVSDGYIVVGSVAKTIKQVEENTRDAIILKYDENGNIIWQKTYTVLSDTEFYKVIQDDNNLIVIGQSIYENMELGNHITGGGIIVKYSLDGELLEKNNFGGNKSGKFSDIIVDKDGYIVCGKDATNYGIVVKFKKSFNRDEKDTNLISKKIMWQRTYSNTDNEGFTSMIKIDDKLLIAGALNISNEKDQDGNPIFKYVAGIVSYNIKSKYLGSYTLNDPEHHRFNSITADNDYIYVSTLLNVDTAKKDDIYKSMIIKYKKTDIKKLENSLVNKNVFDESNTSYIINKIVNINNNIIYVGTANNKCGLLTGCDYQGIIEKN